MSLPRFVPIALIATGALGAGSPVRAQSTGRSATGTLPKQIMLLDWERQKKNVLAYINAMPDSAITFAPTPGVRNFAQQIQHFVGTNTEIAAMTLKGLKQPPTLGDTAQYLHQKAALLEWTTTSYDYLIDALKGATPPQLTRSFTLYNQPTAPAWRWLELSKEHAVWTFGQLIPYLRLNKVTPPAYDMPF